METDDIRGGRRGRPARPVHMFTMDGRPMHVFGSSVEASASTGVNRGDISACCLGRRLSAGGYRWSFSASAPPARRPRSPRSVHQYRMDGSYVRAWPSVTEAARRTGVSAGNIYSCCHPSGRLLSAGGYRWSYDEGVVFNV